MSTATAKLVEAAQEALARNEPDEAAKLCQKAIEIDPGDYKGTFFLLICCVSGVTTWIRH